MEVKCPTCGGTIGDSGWCVLCDPLPLTDAVLHEVVGGMTALTSIGVGLALARVYQGSKLWRDRKNKN